VDPVVGDSDADRKPHCSEALDVTRLRLFPRAAPADLDSTDRPEAAAVGRPATLDLGFVLLPTLAPLVLGLVLGTAGPAFTAGLALTVGLLILSLWRLRAQPILLFVAVFLWLSIERIAVAVISPRLEMDSLRWILAYKEVIFPALFLILLPRAQAAFRDAPPLLRLCDGLAILFGVMVMASFLLSDAPVMDRIVNGRRLAMLPLVYLVARLIPWNAISLRSMLSMLIAGAFVVSLLGLAERTILEQLLWLRIVPAAYYYHLSSLAGLSATGTDFPVDGLPVVFYDFTSGGPQRRLVSTFLEPTTGASFLALAATLALAIRRPRGAWLIVPIVIGAATLLALSKAGWAILAIGVGYTIAVVVVRRFRDPAWLISLAATLLGALLVIAVTLEATGLAAGPLAHFQGLKEGIESAVSAPLGLGLGYGGNFGASKLGAESTFGVTLVQLGWPGLAVWAGWLLILAIATARLGRALGSLELVALATAATLSAFFATAALTESAGGLLGNWLYAIAAGAIVTVAGTTSLRSARSDPTEPDPSHRRTRFDGIVLIGAPIVLNLGLAVGLAVALPRVVDIVPDARPVVGSDPGAGLRRLPKSDMNQLLTDVRTRTGQAYVCSGPWITVDGLRNWACRTDDSLAVMRGRSETSIGELKVTWFGFDTSATDLPVWAEVSIDQGDDHAAAEWVRVGIGGSGETIVGTTGLEVGGGRGAYALTIIGGATATSLAPQSRGVVSTR
jgi:hypothetical protein